MSRACFDWRVWGPLAFAAACFAFRLRPDATAATAPDRAPRGTVLPAPVAAPTPKGDTRWVLDPDKSTMRFLVQGGEGELLAACTHMSGKLRLGGHPETGELELHIDLAGLSPVGQGPSTIDVRRLLGVHLGSEIHYRGALVRSSTTPLPGVTERLWLGTLRLDERLLRQPMQLWQCSLAGPPMRLQGHGTVDVEDYGLPHRSWFGVVQEAHVVTLGLDLAWRRDSTR